MKSSGARLRPLKASMTSGKYFAFSYCLSQGTKTLQLNTKTVGRYDHGRQNQGYGNDSALCRARRVLCRKHPDSVYALEFEIDQPSTGFAPAPNRRRFAVTTTRLSVASRFSTHRANLTNGSPIKK